MMGDIADDLIEEGMTAWMLHQTGQCGELGLCEYCEEEEDEPIPHKPTRSE